MAPIHKVAVIQLYPKPLDPEFNFNKAATFIRSAAKQGAELAVLPEYHLTNWLPKDSKFINVCAQWETYLRKYQDLAKECNICIVPGSIGEYHPGEKEYESKLINVAYFIDNKGEIIGKYVKKNLWHPEREHLTSSGHDAHEVFDTPLGKVGMLICWDLAFPEAFRELISQGAKIIIIPTFCDGPFIGPLTRLGSAAEGMSVVDLDLGILEDAEENYGVRKDLAREDWHYVGYLCIANKQEKQEPNEAKKTTLSLRFDPMQSNPYRHVFYEKETIVS
ncbi:hypothetical protein H2199_000508 [Coniosporium tulheliwenetii]|uniref:Uncharacterized protein n=1 Tax=Coniosporium tulheliwenetii TaxID=3383036 RepID=A0ACC2ZQJ7_9PEZI|nr:hypothetical protein H2199_000508 [Cladosporium sp. JES 115]